MSINRNIAIKDQDWVQLTSDNVTAITFQNRGNLAIVIMATNGENPPAITDNSGIIYGQNEGEDAGKPLAQLFPGVSSPNRVYCRVSGAGNGEVFVSHA